MKRIPITLATLVLLVAATPASAAEPDDVTINVDLVLAGNLAASTTSGTFSASGAITDSGTESGAGRFVGQGHLKTGEPNILDSQVTLTSAAGSITIDLMGRFGRLPAVTATGSGRWVVSGGTGAYAGLHGTGSWEGTADFSAAVAGMGPPRVHLTLVGQVN